MVKFSSNHTFNCIRCGGEALCLLIDDQADHQKTAGDARDDGHERDSRSLLSLSEDNRLFRRYRVKGVGLGRKRNKKIRFARGSFHVADRAAPGR